VKETKSYVNNDFDMNDAIENGVKHTQGSIFDNPTAVKETIQNGVKHTDCFGEYEDYEIDTIIQDGIKNTGEILWRHTQTIEDTIENGIKETHRFGLGNEDEIEDTIQNGVKHTQGSIFDNPTTVKDTIQNGVKETSFWSGVQPLVEDVIQNRVKKTYSDKIPHEYDWTNQFTEEIDIIIENGVKETKLGAPDNRDYFIEDAIQNGVKETTPGGYLGFVEKKGKKIHQFETAKQLYYVEDVIESGIKKTEAAALFDEESKMDTVISEGIKETHDDVMPHTGRVEGVIKNGVKETVDALSSRLPNPVGDVIKNGVKQCIPSHTPLYNPMDFSVEYLENHRLDDVTSVLEKGIKEVQPLPAQDGNRDWGIYYHRQEVPTKPHTQYVDDVITNGIKETKPMDEWVNTERILDGVIDKGIKETKSSGSNFPKWADDVINNGIKS